MVAAGDLHKISTRPLLFSSRCRCEGLLCSLTRNVEKHILQIFNNNSVLQLSPEYFDSPFHPLHPHLTPASTVAMNIGHGHYLIGYKRIDDCFQIIDC